MVPYTPQNDYVKEGPNGGDAQGPNCCDSPKGLAEVPVLWQYNNTTIDLTFKAGFVAATQDIETGIIRPLVGWFIQKK